MQYWSRTSLFILLLLVTVRAGTPYHEAIEKYRMGEEQYKKVTDMHNNWYIHAIKALMGQMGRELFERLNHAERHSMLRCLDKITEITELVHSARCLTSARKEMKQRIRRKQMYLEMSRREWIGGFQTEKDSGSSEVDELAAFPTLSLHRLRDFRARELRVRVRPLRAKRSPYRLISSQVAKSDSFMYNVKQMDHAPDLKADTGKSPVKRFSNMMMQLVKGSDERNEKGSPKWFDTFQEVVKVKKDIDRNSKESNKKVYFLRMRDIVIGRTTPSRTESEKLPPMVRETFDMINVLNPSKKKQTKGVKLLSPRFLPIMPDKNDNEGQLSPSILPFYNDDTEQQIAPLPKLLNASGMSSSDREDLLQMIMEVSGTRETVDGALKMLKEIEGSGLEKQLISATQGVKKIFDDLQGSLNRRQHDDMETRGYTFMTGDQMRELHARQGLSQRDDYDFPIDTYASYSTAQFEESLWLKIEHIAMNTTRFKRQFQVISVLEPTILAPYQFAPVYGAGVLGPTILSPSIFSPLILNPGLLSPYIFSPAIAMPFIVSPYVLGPYIFSPLVMAPFILSPYVLAPNVINPYVLSPLILSPLVLCPDVLSPMVLGGGILSPSVLSPAVLSKSSLMVSVLNPSFLSKRRRKRNARRQRRLF